MKKRTLFAALLVIPMGAAFAWHQGVNRTQSGKITTGGYESETYGTPITATGEAEQGGVEGFGSGGQGPKNEERYPGAQ